VDVLDAGRHLTTAVTLSSGVVAFTKNNAHLEGLLEIRVSILLQVVKIEKEVKLSLN
jgi:uncharacterized membrane-anchored protein